MHNIPELTIHPPTGDPFTVPGRLHLNGEWEVSVAAWAKRTGRLCPGLPNWFPLHALVRMTYEGQVPVIEGTVVRIGQVAERVTVPAPTKVKAPKKKAKGKGGRPAQRGPLSRAGATS